MHQNNHYFDTGIRDHGYKQQETNSKKSGHYQMTVRGNGEVAVRPDQAKLTVGVVTENQNLEDAQRENALLSNRVIQAIKQHGIEDRFIKTSHYSIQPLYDYVGGKSVFRTYQVDHQIEVTVRDIRKVGLIYEVAIKNGANRGGNVQFIVSNPDIYYRQALRKAVLNASEKAEEIARTIGAVINKLPIRVVEELEQPNRPIPFSTYKLAAATVQEAPPIQQGEFTIDAQVTSTYQYLHRYA
ncbi:SIMPL domain-containing protein [Bacillus marasmi]|uniref:SIMPL domain-containing protein n=1 Tax=Bacillus marasmi TaxID=1926279 RepID=UPI0011CA44FE|nr:SIMPL domain-containing protein [Bacillus marasmi]